MARKLLERLTFIPWYLIQTKILHKSIDLERLYKNGYCSDFQYKILRAEPIRHGKWENDGVFEICSVCKFPTIQPHINMQPQHKYCPNCGAKMDGGDKNE